MRDAVLERSQDGSTRVFSTLEWKRRLETFGAKDAPVIATGPGGELDGVCDMGKLAVPPRRSVDILTGRLPGMLTDKGRLTTLELGERLRSLYVDRLGFLPKTINSADFIYLRSTPVPRALESLQQAFTGLYPAHTRAADFPPPTILTRVLKDETLLPNDSSCRRFAVLAQAFSQRTADRWNPTEEMKYLTKIYGKWMPESNHGKVAVDSKPRLSGIMDTVNSTLAHGPETRLPKEFYDPKARQIIEKIGVEEWFSGFKESQEYRKLGVGGLMGDITARMVGRAEHSPADGEYELMHKPGHGPAAIRFGMSGCHDTTLAGCLASVGAFPGDSWPPFTSHIAFELFEKDRAAYEAAAVTKASGNQAIQGYQKQPTLQEQQAKTSWFGSLFSSRSPAGQPPSGIGRTPMSELSEAKKDKLDGYYVRLRYNDEVVTVPGCKPAGKHLEGDESFCTLVCSTCSKFLP